MKRIIAISVYGTDPKYVAGAMANIPLASKHYPGWTLRFYTDNAEFRPVGDHVEVVRMRTSNGSSGMFWRFLAAGDREADTVVFRDSDSRLNPREAAAVAHWLREGRKFHVMRDHQDHAHWPMLGGMWGVRGGVLADIRSLIERWPSHVNKLDDMQFLRHHVWPQAVDSMTHHTSVKTIHPDGIPFPAHEPWSGFVGEIVEAEHAGV